MHTVHRLHDLPAVWGLRDAGHNGDGAWSEQLGEIQPTLGVSGVSEGGEWRHFRRIASGTSASLGEMRVSSGQGRPDWLVEQPLVGGHDHQFSCPARIAQLDKAS